MKKYIGVTKPIRVVSEASANVDANYGPYSNVEEATSYIPKELRKIGLTVGIIINNKVVEYWWESGVSDSDLIVKTISSLSQLDNTDTNFMDEDSVNESINIETARAIAAENKLNSEKLDASIYNSMYNNGVNKRTSVKTYNGTVDSLESVYGLEAAVNGTNGKAKQNGWDVEVREDETKGGKSNRYNWNGEEWIDMNTGVYNDDVAKLGGYNGTLKDVNNNIKQIEVLSSDSVVNPIINKSVVNGLFVDLLLIKGSVNKNYAPTQIFNNDKGAYRIAIFSLKKDGAFEDNILNFVRGNGVVKGDYEIFEGVLDNYFIRYKAVIDWTVLVGEYEGNITTIKDIRFNDIVYSNHVGYINQSDTNALAIKTSSELSIAKEDIKNKLNKIKILSENSTITGIPYEVRNGIIVDALFERGSAMTGSEADYLQLTQIKKEAGAVGTLQFFTCTEAGEFKSNILNLKKGNGTIIGAYEYFEGIVGNYLTEYKVLVDWSFLDLLPEGQNTAAYNNRLNDLLYSPHIGDVFMMNSRSSNGTISQNEGLTDMVLIPISGQSLASAVNGVPIVSTEAKYPNLYRFKGGVRVYDMLGLLAQYRKTYITRKGAPKYGELLDPAVTLSAFDAQQLSLAYGSLVSLNEQAPLYKSRIGDTDAPKTGFILDPSGTYKHVHNVGETSMTGFAERLNQVLMKKYDVEANQLNYDVIVSAPAYGSATFQSLLPLDKGGTIHIDLDTNPAGDGSNLNYFEVLIKDVTEAKKHADSKGKSFSVPALLYFHEGTDISSIAGVTTPLNARRILQMFTLMNTRIRQITGQTNDIVFMVHQSSLSQSQANALYYLAVNDGNVDAHLSAEQLNLVKTLPNYEVEPYSMDNVIMGAPSYPYEFVEGDFVHHTGLANRLIGETFSLAYNQHRHSKDKYKPIHPSSYKVIDNADGTFSTYLKLHVPVLPLVLDENAIHGTSKNPTCIARGDKNGFVFSTNGGSATTNIITSVEVVEGDTIKIVTNQTPINKFLQYAYLHTNHPDWVSGTRGCQWGNMRDSQGDIQRTTINNVEYPLHNWGAGWQIKIKYE